MSKTIKIDDAVYDQLTNLMRPKETYSQVVVRILLMFDKLGQLRDVLEGAIEYRKGQAERLNLQMQKGELLNVAGHAAGVPHRGVGGGNE